VLVQSNPISMIAPTVTSSWTVNRAVTLHLAIQTAPKLTAYWPHRAHANATRSNRSVSTAAFAMHETRGLKTRSVRPTSPPGTKNAQLSISIARTKALSAQATSTNHGAASPITDRATPITKNAAIPNSASARAVALETDM